ncbi:hypothetical protein TRVA0_002S01530 [Trichomonascus vanleenenianus]|uniref:uncharacterized protein n=1 Tax=Trichomonascus vanleenenianus TaxID=2268995 RepID=UPI003ECA34CE
MEIDRPPSPSSSDTTDTSSSIAKSSSCSVRSHPPVSPSSSPNSVKDLGGSTTPASEVPAFSGLTTTTKMGQQDGGGYFSTGSDSTESSNGGGHVVVAPPPNPSVLPAPALKLPPQFTPRQRRLRPASLDISVAEREKLAVNGSLGVQSHFPTPNSATSLTFGITSPNGSALTVPESVQSISPAELAELIGPNRTKKILMIDVRPLAQFAVSRVKSADNVCMPTTLLKRPTFVLSRFLECMSPNQKSSLGNLEKYDAIVLYDQSCKRLSPSHTTLFHTLLKFHHALTDTTETKICWLRGGIADFSTKFADLIDTSAVESPSPEGDGEAMARSSSSIPPLHTVSGAPLVMSGISLPEACKVRLNPFSTNIRTAMEVYDENDGIDIVLPAEVDKNDDDKNRQLFPEWLCKIIKESDSSKSVAKLFYDIEMAEKNRLEEALNAPSENKEGMLAGVELGAKNRYTNIWPFDHSRVRIRDASSPSADYINASYVSAKGSDRRYIATQGPLPATYEDFWKVVWYERIPVILMLTPEHEGGTLKCDLYWQDGVMGAIELRVIGQSVVPLNTSSNSMVVIRRFELKNARDPSQPTHQTVQIQYTDWPDLGSPASPEDLLALSRLKEEYLDPSRKKLDLEPICLVHCSAGCGRTGTFCTVDTATDIFEQYYRRGQMPEFDVIHQVVHDLRRKRISMVQNLRQYGMCYETVLQWCVEWAKKSNKM